MTESVSSHYAVLLEEIYSACDLVPENQASFRLRL